METLQITKLLAFITSFQQSSEQLLETVMTKENKQTNKHTIPSALIILLTRLYHIDYLSLFPQNPPWDWSPFNHLFLCNSSVSTPTGHTHPFIEPVWYWLAKPQAVSYTAVHLPQRLDIPVLSETFIIFLISASTLTNFS